MGKYKHAVLLIIETDDEEMNPALLDTSSRDAARTMRAAVFKQLPHNITKIVSLMHEDIARLVMTTAEALASLVPDSAIRFTRPSGRAVEDLEPGDVWRRDGIGMVEMIEAVSAARSETVQVKVKHLGTGGTLELVLMAGTFVDLLAVKGEA